MRLWLLVFLALAVAAPLRAQEFSARARLDPAQSQITDTGGGLSVVLDLSQVVPFRVFTLDAPRRLVVDFRELDWTGASRAGLLNADNASDLRFGVLRPGWSRLVVDLAAPMVLQTAGMTVDDADATARLEIVLRPGSAEEFAAQSGAPDDPDWTLAPTIDPTLPAPDPASPDDGILTVMIDPGHGGIDPGAEREGLKEADLMLAMAVELSEALTRAGGFRPILTRQSDIFVPLQERMTLARSAGAEVFLSLHADALEEDAASGASAYTLGSEGADQASARMAERHDRGDLLAGLDLSGQDDTVATVLMDLARLETGPQSRTLADALVAGLSQAGARLNSQPRREATLAVLAAADFPSVLLEVGFLSSARDRQMLATAEGRAPVVAGMVLALQRWAEAEAARAPLLRQ